MFDIAKTGAKIAKLRRDKDMTQMELAERMNISYQAVSSWERGQTMPDIGKLGELADIFGVSVDELLDRTPAARVAEKLAQGEETPEVTPTELQDVAPLLKPKEIDSLLRTMFGAENTVLHAAGTLGGGGARKEESGGAQEEGQHAWTLHDAAAFAPFMSEETLSQVLREALQNGADAKALAGLAPFLSEEDLAFAVDALLAKNAGGDGLRALLPFVDEKTADAIAQRLFEQGQSVSAVVPVAPFLEEKAVDALALRAAQTVKSGEELACIAPFMTEKGVSAAADVLMRRLGPASIRALLPFMD